ncbi:Bardet-Biedl syndrome 1 protein homolog isoform X2 [Leptopilina boulardi]|uniref:Bardet-Biedl syndrome 1 protein homolog isoform X2 n=1 Tax=Leptopilina boulardi TaxID=63433 RepID=UPI0021F68B16|nr:Bardet-Biedl syndrome 1 protein homolog isoform X2 [Leptopilina boulardi]
MERTKPEFQKSRWLQAIWEPGTRIYSLPGGIDMIDISGEGDARLITADLGNSLQDTPRIRVFKEETQVTEHNMIDAPCGVVGFYSENGNPRSAAVAVGAGASVFIFKNMRPHFKFCLPYLDAHPKEREIWHKAGLEDEINVLNLADDLELLLKELGAGCLSSRTLKFLAMDKNLRASFAEQYRVVPLIRMNAVTTIGVSRKDSWADYPSSFILVGTESGEIFMLDPRAFFMTEKITIGWPPVSTTCTGLWNGDGQIIVIGREGQLGSIKKGCLFKMWDILPAPIVSIAPLTCEGAAVASMDGTYYGFSKTGMRMWRINLSGMPLDLVSLPVQQSVVSLLAVSVAKIGIKIYDEKHHVDTIKMMDSVSAIKYGRLGQEERAMSMVTTGGGLCVKILKRTADFSVRSLTTANSNSESNFMIPKKTRLFVEQTLRERTEASKIHKIFQQGLIRLRLTVAKKAFDALSNQQESMYRPISIESSVIGLGPRYRIRSIVTNVTEEASETDLFFVYKTNNVDCRPRVSRVPILAPGIPITFSSNATLINYQLPGKVKLLLCKKDVLKPLQIINIALPAAEEDIDV